MTGRNIDILNEFNDDVDALCTAIRDLRGQIAELNEHIEVLNDKHQTELDDVRGSYEDDIGIMEAEIQELKRSASGA